MPNFSLGSDYMRHSTGKTIVFVGLVVIALLCALAYAAAQ